MKRYDLIVVGAGPSGLSAAIEAAKRGLKVVVFDENEKPGGQLFKQIHKFFGSKEHKARIRGVDIGAQLVKQAEEVGAKVVLDAAVMGIFPHKDISIMKGDRPTATHMVSTSNSFSVPGTGFHVLSTCAITAFLTWSSPSARRMVCPR